MNILLTGGAGYIGSHTAVELLNSGYEVVIVDNLNNSSEKAVSRIEQITDKKVKFYKLDVCNEELLSKVFEENEIEGVIHFAGYKAVGESVAKPVMYYENNINSTLTLLKVMKKYGVKNLVFSSSATVYKQSSDKLNENSPLGASNPYGRTKLFIEEILKDFYNADKTNNVAILRYFNPVGAHKSGLIGEQPNGIPNNLMPYISQVSVGKLAKLNIFGNDYPTYDGTGVRDYIHVCDLAVGHLLALQKLSKNAGLFIVNLGTGRGCSVLELVKTFIKVTGVDIPYVFAPRRPGDLPEVYADCDLATKLLNFKAKYSVEDMCLDTYNWQKNNPNGYDD